MKSRYNWIIEGDRNTNFFHNSVIIQRKHNKIISLNDAVGNEIVDSDLITKHILDFFKELFTTDQIACGRTEGGLKRETLL